MSVLLAAVTAISLAGCSNEQAESAFDNPLPWHDDISISPTSYEQFNYSACVYDTSKGTAEDKRVQIANGEMTFTLNETSSYTTLKMDFTLTYNAEAGAGEDAGKTDTISSTVEFETNSLAAKSSEKTVTLSNRDGKTNQSYKVTADYFDKHEATFTRTAEENAQPRTMSLPKNASHDNEMMFFLARAQGLGKGSSTNFKMINLFDSFTVNSLTEYTMTVTGNESLRTVDIGDFVKDFGVEAVTNEDTGETTYPVSCYYTSIAISGEQSGPPYIVYYTENPFTQGERKHSKIPVIISYSLYNGNNPSRFIEYTLTSCTFEK